MVQANSYVLQCQNALIRYQISVPFFFKLATTHIRKLHTESTTYEHFETIFFCTILLMLLSPSALFRYLVKYMWTRKSHNSYKNTISTSDKNAFGVCGLYTQKSYPTKSLKTKLALFDFCHFLLIYELKHDNTLEISGNWNIQCIDKATIILTLLVAKTKLRISVIN